MKTKVVGNKGSVSFPQGGKNHMLGKKHAGPQKPGVTTQEGAYTSGKNITGGSGHMISKGGANPQTPAQTTAGGMNGAGQKWAEGGKGHMVGKTGSMAAKPGQSSPC